MKKINVLFRTCDCVNSVNAKRALPVEKSTLIKVCFLSLFESLREFPNSIQVIGDRLSPEMVRFFGHFPVSLTNGTFGNDASLVECTNRSLSLPDNELVYFCEDDYLHEKNEIVRIMDFLEEYGRRRVAGSGTEGHFRSLSRKPLFIFPVDYPDSYADRWLKPGYILLSDTGHWRQVHDVTFTFLTDPGTIRRHRRIFLKSTIRARDWLLSRKLFYSNRCQCWCPIPSAATHMHAETQAPFFKWQELFDYYKERIPG